jgi:arylsulfatase
LFLLSAELAGVKISGPMDGASLVPVLRGEKEVVRDWLHLEHAPCYSQEQAFHALTDGTYKYIWRPLDGSEQHFNLEKDPREETGFSQAADYRARLERARATCQTPGRPARGLFSRWQAHRRPPLRGDARAV